MTCSLSISVVTHQPDIELLARLLDSLEVCIQFCSHSGMRCDSDLMLVDNSVSESARTDLIKLSASMPASFQIPIRLYFAKNNLGYGGGHNCAIVDSKGDYHLVLNPDVVLEESALFNALQYMERHRNIGLLTPHATGHEAERQYLCKRYPTVLDLFLRGFVPAQLRSSMAQRLAHYEMQDLEEHQVATGIPIASGCFMLIRTSCLKQLVGFNAKFFMYFEDFDLSMRLRQIADIAYVPTVRIKHYGGKAARKGLQHVFWFICSAARFFTLHGWKLW